MKTITIFTPTYNRAYLLPRLYQSLCNQTSKDFLWLIIDDGSVDNTKEIVKEWTAENKIEIQYHYKENGGMHTAHNMAYKNIDTELNVCIDSDDYMPKDAVEKILNTWDSIKDKHKIAGIIGIDANTDGKIIGTEIPEYLYQGSLIDLYNKHKIKGDKKVVLRTDIVKKYPAYPEYKGEKLVPLGILYLMIGADYDFIYKDDVYCIVEYQTEGSSGTILKQYKQSPRGFAYSRKIQIQYIKDFRSQLKNYAHLISSSLFAKDCSIAFKGVNAFKVLAFYPFGILLHMYILIKIKSS